MYCTVYNHKYLQQDPGEKGSSKQSTEGQTEIGLERKWLFFFRNDKNKIKIPQFFQTESPTILRSKVLKIFVTTPNRTRKILNLYKCIEWVVLFTVLFTQSTFLNKLKTFKCLVNFVHRHHTGFLGVETFQKPSSTIRLCWMFQGFMKRKRTELLGSPTLLEKQSKFLRQNMKCRGEPDTT